MGIKMSGMISGLDTDAIVKELMSAQSLKKTKIEKKKTKLNWKQDKWKELNTKIYALYTDTVSKMRMQGNYKTKKVSSSDESKATVTATNSAAKGAHKLEVEELASAQYLTGGVIKRADGGNVTSATTLKDLGIAVDTIITIDGADKRVSKVVNGVQTTVNDDNLEELIVTESTTIADFVSSCQKAGLNATYDSDQGRLFISSSDTGEEQKFTITTAASTDYVQAGKKLNDLTGYSSLPSADREKIDNAYKTLKTSADPTEIQDAKDLLAGYTETHAKNTYDSGLTAKLDEAKAKFKEEEYKKEIVNLSGQPDDPSKNKTKWIDDYKTNNPGTSDADAEDAYEDAKTAWNNAVDKVNNGTDPADVAFREGVQQAIDQDFAAPSADGTTPAGVKYAAIQSDYVNEKGTRDDYIAAAATDLSDTITKYVDAAKDIAAGGGTGGVSPLTNLGLAEITGEAITDTSGADVSGLTVVAAKDSVIVLDGARMKNSSNQVSVNYMTLNLKDKTTSAISFTVSDDTDATYDMVKDFVNQYNSLLKEMNELYNADSAKGYEPLTDEEKEVMSDDEIEKWEAKIKGSLLRRDNTLGSLTSAMRTALTGQVTVDGVSYSLASFGIKTSSDYTEQGLLHIFGDEDDDTYSTEKNALKNALLSDPETVMKVLSEVSQNLYSTMADKMARSSISSALTFYNDKEMKNLNTNYDKQLKQWETRLADLESRYYKQFSAMEVALSKLQNQQNSLASLMGVSS